MNRLSTTLSVVASDRNHLIAIHRNILIVDWLNETTVTAVRRVSTSLRSIAERHPIGIGLVQIVERGTRSLGADARTALANMLSENRKAMRCSVVICDGEGFRASAVRMIVSGVALVSNPGFPHEVFADVASGVRTMSEYMLELGARTDEFVSSLTASIAEVRERARYEASEAR